MSYIALIEQATTYCELLDHVEESRFKKQAISAKKLIETQIKKYLSSSTQDNLNGLDAIVKSVSGWLADIESR